MLRTPIAPTQPTMPTAGRRARRGPSRRGRRRRARRPGGRARAPRGPRARPRGRGARCSSRRSSRSAGRARTSESGSARAADPRLGAAPVDLGLGDGGAERDHRGRRRSANCLGSGGPRMWNGKDVSVVLMTYAERDSIRAVIDGFLATGVRRRGRRRRQQRRARHRARRSPARPPGSSRSRARATGTRRGAGCWRRAASWSCSPSPTARSCPSDITKLLVYSGECDVVFGTRTTRELIWAGANMDWFLRWGNWAVAKLIEVLFNTSHLSDVGCTYRVLRRPVAERRRGRDEGRREPRRRRDHAAGDRRPAPASSRSRSTTCRGWARPRSPAAGSSRSASACG